MAARLAVARMLAGPEEWDRRKLQILLGVAVALALALLAGIIWSVVALLRADANSEVVGDRDAGAVDVVQPDGSDPLDAAQAGPLSTSSTGTIRVPQPDILGESQVATGFPRTPEGALAQLVAIDQRAIQSASVVAAQDVIAAWAAPGGPTADSWSGVAAVRTLLESAGLPAAGTDDLVVELHPAMGVIQEADGDNATVCVDFILAVTIPGGQPSRIAAADCQHMTWQGRWLIAPGPEAASTPSLWPGTQASYDAGYQWLEVRP